MTVKVILKNWLANQNNISKEMIGVVEAESEKAILFNGRAFAEERMNCMRCSRELTHPSSRLVGFGPICCEKLGLAWPEKEELTQEEIAEVKAKIAEITFKGWLPKSQIEIIGEYTIQPGGRKEGRRTTTSANRIGVVAKELADGKLDIKGVAIKSEFQHRDKCQALKEEFGGKWNPDRKQWEYPLSIEVVQRAIGLWNGGLEVTPILQDWATREMARTEALLEEKEKVDASLAGNPLANTLYDYQRVGTSFLSKAGRAILGDDMGLGKTIQAIAACAELKTERVLIICPNSLKLNWEREVQRWLPGSKTQVIDGVRAKREEQLKNTEANFIIINFEAVRIHKDMLAWGWDALIIDEAHRVKNRKAQQTKAVQAIAKQAKNVFHLTGTPIMNKPDEIWSLLNILDPKKYSSFWRFVNQYCHVWDNGYGKVIGEAKDPQAFRDMLAPYMIRRTKAEVLKDLPSKTIQKQYVRLMDGLQQRAYKQMEKEMVAEFAEGNEVAAPVVIAQITRLKQLAVSPALLGGEDESAKLDAMMEIIESAGDQKVVVFSQFAEAIKLASKRLEAKGIDHGILIGEVKAEERAKNIDRFQNDPNCKVFLASIQAGGVGITLTSASIAIFLDKHWTPAINNQAADRLHRIGQENPVTIIELIAEGTVEEWIEELLKDKSDTFDSLIDGKVTGIKDILSTISNKAKGRDKV